MGSTFALTYLRKHNYFDMHSKDFRYKGTAKTQNMQIFSKKNIHFSTNKQTNKQTNQHL